jgi:flagellar motor switch protein FliN/FliY
MTALEEIGHIGDVPLTVEVELDRKVMTVSEILALDVGSVIRMMRSAGDNLGIRIGGTPVGSGEVVVIEDSVGVRITDFKEEK